MTDSSPPSELPLILVTNDDGVHAPGIAVLVEVAAQLGTVIVAAPDTERSGAAHSMTFHTHLRARQTSDGWWAVSGTPVDCVYFGLVQLCADRKPDLVLSGVNAGYNLGTDVFYSGTVGAAAEGTMRGVPAVAVSTERGVDPRWGAHAAKVVGRRLLAQGTPALMSVNAPCLPGMARATAAEIDTHARSIPFCVTRLGVRSYSDEVHYRVDPHGREYFWLGGPPREANGAAGDDLWAVANGMVSVTPLVLDLTAPDLQPARDLLAGDPDLRFADPEPQP